MLYGIWQRMRLLFKLAVNFLLAAAIFVLIMSFKNPAAPKAYVYSVARDIVKKSMDLKTFNWYRLEGENFIVKYQPVDADVARLILETAEEAYRPVTDLLGFVPEEKVPVIVYPTRASLNKSFGWEADVNAMGVYWAGVIRILSPVVWLEDENHREEIFKSSGPLAHEYTHLLVDYRTNGNYPRWLTEGIAQYVEREITGFEFDQQPLGESDFYRFKEMDAGFDLLPDQALAYRQSLKAVDYLVQAQGLETVLKILDHLSQGQKIDAALEEAAGQDFKNFEAGFIRWFLEQKMEAAAAS